MAQIRRVHFVGIGGIGVSALARFYRAHGWRVTGSDGARSALIEELRKEGIKIAIGHTKSNLPREAEMLVYSAAVPKENPERMAARKLRIPERSYAEALGEIATRYKLIAVSGAHGKSTTTAMAALILIKAGFDPTVIIGTKVPEFGNSNFRKGNSEWLLIEADEYHRSFHQYRPYAAITTNVDREHLEYYGSFGNVKKAFEKFWGHVNPDGFLVLNREDKVTRSLKPPDARVLWYGTKEKRAQAIAKLLKVPGRHNISNAAAADRLAEKLGIEKRVRNRALASFHGTWRRFELKCAKNGVRIFDDYGHHPTEIRATLAGAKEFFKGKRIICLFQPHHAERLELLFSDFVKAFDSADAVMVLETYQVLGRERGRRAPSKSAEALASQLALHRPALYVRTHREAVKEARKLIRSGDILVVMGAGDITKVSEMICGRV